MSEENQPTKGEIMTTLTEQRTGNTQQDQKMFSVGYDAGFLAGENNAKVQILEKLKDILGLNGLCGGCGKCKDEAEK